MQLLLGTSKFDITPEHEVPLAGFGSRKGVMEGVASRLYARVALFIQRDAGEERKQLVVSADIICWGSERMEHLRRVFEERWGIPARHVLLAASHSHSGPQTTERMRMVGRLDESYVARMEALLFAGIEEAHGNVEAVVTERGSGTCDIGVNRRLIVDGKALFEPNVEGPVDREATVVRFRTDSGATKAVFLHYTCHPTTMNANIVSAEYSGYAAAALERELGGNAVALFMQGCCGDIRPALVRDGHFYAGTDEDARQLGGMLADAVSVVLAGSMEQLAPCLLDGELARCELPFEQMPAIDRLTAFSRGEEQPLKGWAEQLLDTPELVKPSAQLDLTRLDIAEGLSLVAMNAEMVVDYGLFVKARSAGRALPVAYSNGMIGYVSTARQLTEGGYEATGSYYYFGLCAPFAASTEGLIHDALDGLLAGVGAAPLSEGRDSEFRLDGDAGYRKE